MNKFIKKAMALALAGTMTMGMSVTTLAAEIGRDESSKFTENGTTASKGLDSFYLIKDYDSFDKTGEAPYSSSPAETFTYRITPYAVWNAGSTYADQDNFTGVATAITTANMPMLTLSDGSGVSGSGADRILTVNQKVEKGQAKYEESPDTQNAGDEKTEIKLPTYATVGDYWYRVEEDLGNTTGVLYGTNSKLITGDSENIAAANGNYSRVYYVHVQVTETSSQSGTSNLVSNVTMHKSAPDPNLSNAEYNNQYAQNNESGLYVTGNKVNAIENRYYAGELVIKKEVTGNAGDKDQYFEVTVEFTKPQGTVINSDISFTAVEKNGNTYTSTNYVIVGQQSKTNAEDKIEWSGTGDNDAQKTATCTFWVKDDSTVTFSNIPYGINYTIKETKPADDTYKHQFTFETEDTVNTFDGVGLTQDKGTDNLTDNFDDFAQGSITDKNDTVTITNNKESVIDIGVITSNAPYVAILVFAGAMMVLYVRRRKDMIEE